MAAPAQVMHFMTIDMGAACGQPDAARASSAAADVTCPTCRVLAARCNLHKYRAHRACGACYDALRSALPDAVRAVTRASGEHVLRLLADEFDALANGGIPPGVIGVFTAFDRAAQLARFAALQVRDGLPCPDTGITHCRACHGADGDPLGPRCGHTAGCPEC